MTTNHIAKERGYVDTMYTRGHCIGARIVKSIVSALTNVCLYVRKIFKISTVIFRYNVFFRLTINIYTVYKCLYYTKVFVIHISY